MLALIQQSICAIEFIGVTLSSRKTDVQAFRDVRDELFATTDAGRKWISLYERIQIPLLGAVLANESLTRQVISLLERARKLLKNDEAVVSDIDVQRGLALMDSLAQCETLAGLRRDMTTVRKLIKEAEVRACVRSSKTSSGLDDVRFGKAIGDRHGSPEMYVRKHWYEVATDSDGTIKLYFERQARGGRRGGEMVVIQHS